MGIGMRELLIILAIALVLFGAKRLRTIGSDLGSALRGFKDAVRDSEDRADAPESRNDRQRPVALAKPYAQTAQDGMKPEPSSAKPQKQREIS